MTAEHTMTDVTILLDASFDLLQGHGGDETAFAEYHEIDDEGEAFDAFVEDFADAYIGAADSLGEKLGIRIYIDSPEITRDGGSESEPWARECELWQLLHDLVYWDADDCCWDYNEAGVEKLASKLRRRFAAEGDE